MKNREQFENTVSKLVNAYFDGTLGRGLCEQCAVGTLCGGESVWAIKFMTSVEDNEWDELRKFRKYYAEKETDVVICHPDKGRIVMNVDDFHNDETLQEAFDWKFLIDRVLYANKVIERTGYTQRQLADIEHAFETAKVEGGFNSTESQFHGLIAVLDVLFDIHEVEDNIRPHFQQKFEGHPEMAY